MKRKILVLLAAAILAVTALTGCSNSESHIDGKAESGIGEQSGDQNAEETGGSGEETSDSEKSEDYQVPSKFAMSKYLDVINDWMGLQFMYDPTTDYEALDNDTAVEIAAFACFDANSDLEWDYDKSCFVIPKSMMDEKMQNLFGKTYNMEKYVPKKRGYVKTDTGVVYLTAGDWGLVTPKYEIISSENCGDGKFDAVIKYYAFDYETGKEYGSYRYDVELSCRLDDSSEYGFVLTNFKAKRTGSDPAAFDPASVAGCYVAEIPEIMDEETIYRKEWLVINDNGTGYIYNKDKTAVTISRYEISLTESQEDYDYIFIEDQMRVFYSGGDEYRAYERTDEEPRVE